MQNQIRIYRTNHINFSKNPMRITNVRWDWNRNNKICRYYYINGDRRGINEAFEGSLTASTEWAADSIEDYRAWERGEID